MPAESGGAVVLSEADLPAAPASRGRRLPIVSLGIIAVFVLLAILAPLLSPADPHDQSLRNRFKPPVWQERGSWAHPLGTDRLGRDMLSRIIWGSRISLAAGVLTVLLASAFGAAVGLMAGYYGGRVDAALMGFTDATLSFPVILLALILAVTVGPSFTNVVDRHRRDPLGALRPRDPRPGPDADGARLHRAGAHRGRRRVAHHHAPPLPQHAQHARRPGHAPDRLRHHRGGVAVVPRRRHPAARRRPGAR